MSDNSSVDASELHELAADVSHASAAAERNLRKALEFTARGTKDSWKEKLEDSESIPRGAASITYDIDGDRNERRADIGPQPGRPQATIVGITETGTPTIAPRGLGPAALRETADASEPGIEIAIDDALKWFGL